MLLLSIASYFEQQITEIIYDYVHKKSNQNIMITSFVQRKAISRQYHTFFDWNAKNSNSFFGLFGEEFKKQMQDEIRSKEMKDSVKSFLELGQMRNKLVHQNVANYVIDKTSNEIYEEYKQSNKFINLLREKLN